jgi:hypothetical protein
MLDWRKSEVVESSTYEALRQGIISTKVFNELAALRGSVPPLTSVIQVRMYIRSRSE